MRVYLVIMDETEEARVALRFASRRAARTSGNVHMLALVPPQPGQVEEDVGLVFNIVDAPAAGEGLGEVAVGGFVIAIGPVGRA